MPPILQSGLPGRRTGLVEPSKGGGQIARFLSSPFWSFSSFILISLSRPFCLLFIKFMRTPRPGLCCCRTPAQPSPPREPSARAALAVAHWSQSGQGPHVSGSKLVCKRMACFLPAKMHRGTPEGEYLWPFAVFPSGSSM